MERIRTVCEYVKSIRTVYGYKCQLKLPQKSAVKIPHFLLQKMEKNKTF